MTDWQTLTNEELMRCWIATEGNPDRWWFYFKMIENMLRERNMK